MQKVTRKPSVRAGIAAALAVLSLSAQADVVADWNTLAGDVVVESKLGTPPAVRVMAIVQTASYGAVNAITRRDPGALALPAATPDASIEAAVAAANRATLGKLVPAVQSSVETLYRAALAQIPDGPAKSAGIAVGEAAAAATLAQRAEDNVAVPDAYRPQATSGLYVPTASPAATQWPQRRPWLMTAASQFRPGPPPMLAGEDWARDYNEVRTLGAKNSTRRSAEETEIARFWEYSLPPIYFTVVQSAANQPGRDVTRNARLYAAVAQAMDDGMIAVFDAKYQYNFWRPATAIRNGDADGNDATVRDATWAPFIDTPMHPEYPSAHSILAGSVAEILKAEFAGAPMPSLQGTSPTAKGVTRRWTSPDDFAREVANARIYEGVHFRAATDVGTAMGRRIGGLAVSNYRLLAE